MLQRLTTVSTTKSNFPSIFWLTSLKYWPTDRRHRFHQFCQLGLADDERGDSRAFSTVNSELMTGQLTSWVDPEAPLIDGCGPLDDKWVHPTKGLTFTASGSITDRNNLRQTPWSRRTNLSWPARSELVLQGVTGWSNLGCKHFCLSLDNR